uniref:diacylglycerol O-acyltransferase n=1 Tax=Aegilops tauschii subsp. strangulata TaxID=200361 RepID=A0A453FD06_AEGTS
GRGPRGAGEPDGAAVPGAALQLLHRVRVRPRRAGRPGRRPGRARGHPRAPPPLLQRPGVQVMDELEEDATPKWVRTTVDLDDHVIVPDLEPTGTSADPDRALENYVSSLSTLPMDHSRPLWELHVLDFPTSDAAAALVLRVHHSVGDGVSLLSLFIAC